MPGVPHFVQPAIESIGRDQARFCLVRLNLRISFYELTSRKRGSYSLGAVRTDGLP